MSKRERRRRKRQKERAEKSASRQGKGYGGGLGGSEFCGYSASMPPAAIVRPEAVAGSGTEVAEREAECFTSCMGGARRSGIASASGAKENVCSEAECFTIYTEDRRSRADSSSESDGSSLGFGKFARGKEEEEASLVSIVSVVSANADR